MGSGGLPCAVWVLVAAAGLCGVATGCGSVTGAVSSAQADGLDDFGLVVHEPTDDDRVGGGDVNEPEPGSGPEVPDLTDPFLKAVPVTVGASTLTIEGIIASPEDVNIYDIGPVQAGDYLVLDARALTHFDAVAAVFDADENLIYANDDRAYYADLIDPKIEVQIRHPSDPCYVAVAASFGTETSGRYALDLTLTEAPAPEPNGSQTVYFNFEGAEGIRIGTRPQVEIAPFEGSLIAPEFAGQTDTLIARIMGFIREDYIGLDVSFVCSREAGPPAGFYTTVHFGAYDPDLLGVADSIDEYNEQLRQTAIVFVDTFQAFLPLEPTLDEMAYALANVAAHETGHLLGLQHTQEPRGIMDIGANLRQMMNNQAFLRSPLDPYVFPVGYQDAAQLLVESVGGDLTLVKTASLQQISMRAQHRDLKGGPAARKTHVLSTCFCPSCLKAQHREAAAPGSFEN